MLMFFLLFFEPKMCTLLFRYFQTKDCRSDHDALLTSGSGNPGIFLGPISGLGWLKKCDLTRITVTSV